MMRRPAEQAISGKNNNVNGVKLRKGLWSPEEDEKLMSYMMLTANNGEAGASGGGGGGSCWRDVARNAGLQRCGKSCRLRWINYLRPDLKRGAFSPEEEDLILHLHSILGNRWSQIAIRLPGRTDNEIKNFWNSTVKKRLKNSSAFSSIPPSSYTSDSSSKYSAPMYIECSSSLSSTSASASMPFLAQTSYFGAPQCPTQLGMSNGELFVPNLETTASIQDNGIAQNLVNRSIFDNPTNNSNSISNNNNDTKIEDTLGMENGWEGDGPRVGEWDLEELMKDVTSFPFLDF